jgi:heavy metal sensor kinase
VRLPIRVRLTAWYAVLLAAIIVGLGAFVVWQLRADLVQTVDRELRASSTQIGLAYSYEGPGDFADVSGTVLPHGSSAAQVLDRDGSIRLEYGEAVPASIAPPDVRADAFAGKERLFTVHLSDKGERYRALVTPVRRRGRNGGRDGVLVVAQSLRNVDESVDQVLILLLLAGPAALLATAIGGWWLARKALLPVGRMTSKAESIGIDRLDERIAPPRTADEIGHLAVTLNAMLDRLEEGVKEKRRLVADASHELRTPLAAMRAELGISLRGDDLSPTARVVLESTLEEVERMSRTVDNLLTLARVDEGRLELLTSRVDMLEACEAAADPLRPLAAAKGLRFSVDGESCDAEADPQRLHQAIRNFVENAIKYARTGGEVTITAWCTEHEVGVTVTDNGPGIPPGAREHIFDRFYRVDSARGRDGGGSGLGLAICREIAHAHGGRVSVESQEGQGSAFTLALPRIPAEDGPDSGRAAPAGRSPAPTVSA